MLKRFWGPDVDADVDDELRFHLEERIDALVARGLAPAAARAQAVEEFGDVAAVRDALRAIDRRVVRQRGRAEWRGAVAQDVRHALRRLVRQPGYSLVLAATLALGLGAATAVFTLLDAVVLRPLPYADAARLVRLQTAVPGVGAETRWGLARAEFLHFQANARRFDRMGLYRFGEATLAAAGDAAAAAAAGTGQAEHVRTAQVSAGVGPTLGARIALGRALEPADNLSQAPQVALLSDALWRRRFGADSAVVGRTILLGGRPVQVAGVLAPGARLPEELALSSGSGGGGGGGGADLWVPLWLDPAQPPANNHVFRALARLAPGAALEAARDELARLTARLPEVLPGAYSPEFMRRTGFATEVLPLRDHVLGGMARTLWTLFGAVGLVLAIAGANAANLFLARLETRRRELALRTALGAGRAHLARHLLAETLSLAAAAALLALAFAQAAVGVLRAVAPAGLPRLDEVRVGWTAAAFAALVSLALGALFGLLPIARPEADAGMLREAGRGLTASRRQRAARGALVVVQVALSLVLLAGAALLLRSYRALSAVRPGVDAAGVLAVDVVLPPTRYDSAAKIADFYRRLAERVEALPGVEGAGFTSYLPLTGEYGCSGIVVEKPVAGAGEEQRGGCVPVALVGPGFFRALGIGVRGRAPSWSEVSSGTQLAVVSEAFARRFWPGREALGEGLLPGNTRIGRFDVIGVAADTRAEGLDRPPPELVFLPIVPSLAPALGLPRAMTMVVRARTDEPESLAPALRRVLAELDPQVAMTNVRPMRDVLARSLARRSFTTLLLGVAAAVALLLSGVGIYGMIAYLVTQRRPELGVRLALGAGRAQVGWMVVAQSLRLAAVGVAIGLAASLVATRSLRSLLYGVTPTDPAALAAVSAFLLLLAVAAAYAPARRAMRVDPVEVLRGE